MFDLIVGKENFWNWIFISMLIVIGFYVVVIITIRIYYIKFNKKWKSMPVEEAAKILKLQPEMVLQKILEIIITDTCILGTCFVYTWYTQTFPFWSDYNTIVLLGLIIIAIMCNNRVDKKIGNSFGKYNEKDVASLRLLSSIVILIMIIWFSVFYKSEIFKQLSVFILGLILGRFIFFDTTIQDFYKTVIGIIRNMAYAIIALLITMIIMGIGIAYEVIDAENFLLSILGGHIFLLVVINVTREIIKDFI